MSLNLKKCNVVAFKGTASVALGGHILNTAAVQKDLGIQVSESLSWACHVEKRTTKALKCASVLLDQKKHAQHYSLANQESNLS